MVCLIIARFPPSVIIPRFTFPVFPGKAADSPTAPLITGRFYATIDTLHGTRSTSYKEDKTMYKEDKTMAYLKEKWSQMTAMRKAQWVLFGSWAVSMIVALILGGYAYLHSALGIYALLMGLLGFVQTWMDRELSLRQKLLNTALGTIFLGLVALVVLEDWGVLSLTDQQSLVLTVGAFVFAALMLLILIRQDEKKKSKEKSADKQTFE